VARLAEILNELLRAESSATTDRHTPLSLSLSLSLVQTELNARNSGKNASVKESIV
jgi:hypothetical protein